MIAKREESNDGRTIILGTGLMILGLISVAFLTPLSEYNPFLKNNNKIVTEVVENGDYYKVHYEWQYNGRTWTYDSEILKSVYRQFKEKVRTSNYEEYVRESTDDELILELASKFKEDSTKENFNDYQTISLILSFVQSMNYTHDNVSVGSDEYPRYPIETIVDKGGDCEDSCILFSSIVKAMGYGTALIILEKEKHMGAGIKISQKFATDWERSYPLTYYSKTESTYAYCETTNRGWKLGEMPERLKDREAQIIEIF